MQNLVSRLLKARQILHHTLTNSTQQGQVTLIARCKRCVGCSKAWCFSIKDQSQWVVAETGEHGDTPNAEALKRHHAKTYAERSTPGRALKQMRTDQVTPEHIPSEAQLKHMRKQLKQQMASGGNFSEECVGELKEFLDSPPPGLEGDFACDVFCTYYNYSS